MIPVAEQVHSNEQWRSETRQAVRGTPTRSRRGGFSVAIHTKQPVFSASVFVICLFGFLFICLFSIFLREGQRKMYSWARLRGCVWFVDRVTEQIDLMCFISPISANESDSFRSSSLFQTHFHITLQTADIILDASSTAIALRSCRFCNSTRY